MLRDNVIYSRTLLEGITIDQNTANVIEVDLKDYPCAQNRFALEVNGTSGTGVVDITYTVSVDGLTYFAPTDTAIISAVTTTSKRSNVAPHTPTFVRFLKFTFTENNTADLVGVNATLIMQ